MLTHVNVHKKFLGRVHMCIWVARAKSLLDYQKRVTLCKVYYISNEFYRNAGLTVDMCGLLVSIDIAIPLLDAALPLKSIVKNGPMREFWRELIQVSHTYPQSSLQSCKTHFEM